MTESGNVYESLQNQPNGSLVPPRCPQLLAGPPGKPPAKLSLSTLPSEPRQRWGPIRKTVKITYITLWGQARSPKAVTQGKAPPPPKATQPLLPRRSVSILPANPGVWKGLRGVQRPDRLGKTRSPTPPTFTSSAVGLRGLDGNCVNVFLLTQHSQLLQLESGESSHYSDHLLPRGSASLISGGFQLPQSTPLSHTSKLGAVTRSRETTPTF